MPRNWIEDDAFNERRRKPSWLKPSGSRRVFRGRIMRLSEKPGDGQTVFYDVVLLYDGESEIDYVASGVVAGDGRPVRPFVKAAAAPASQSVVVGSVITLDTDVSARRFSSPVVRMDDVSTTEDFVEVFPGRHLIIGGGGGGCQAALTNLGGVLFG